MSFMSPIVQTSHFIRIACEIYGLSAHGMRFCSRQLTQPQARRVDASNKNMKTPHSTLYRYSAEAVAAANKLPLGTIAEQEHKDGMLNGEPLIVMMDCLIKYAEAYQISYESKLADDYVLGDEWLNAAKAVRGLLNGTGVIGMKEGRRDSKDNGTVESMFWSALEMAGFTEETAGL